MREETHLMAVAPILPWVGIPEILTGLGIEFLRTSARMADPQLKETFVNLFVEYVEACCEEGVMQLDEGMTLAAVQKRRHQEEQFTRQVNDSLSKRKLTLHSLSMRAVRFRRRSIDRAEASAAAMHSMALESEDARYALAENTAIGEHKAFSWERRVEELEEQKRRLKQCIDETGVALDAAKHEQRRVMSEQDRLRQKVESFKEYSRNEDLDNCKTAALAYSEMMFVSSMLTSCEEVPPLAECVPEMEDPTPDAESAYREFQHAVEDHVACCTQWYERAQREADISNSRTDLLGTSRDLFTENQLREATEALRQARSVSQHYIVDSGTINDNNPVVNGNLLLLQIDGIAPCSRKLDDEAISRRTSIMDNSPQVGGLDDF